MHVKNFLEHLRNQYSIPVDETGMWYQDNDVVVPSNQITMKGPNGEPDYFKEPNINRNSIIICLENLGWLQKEPLTDYYINWIGDIYKGKVYEKKWRDFYFWQPYTEKQINSTVELCKQISKDMSIPSTIIGHNTKINGVNKYEGIVTRSNYYSNKTDLSPAFNFEEFLKKIEHEEQT